MKKVNIILPQYHSSYCVNNCIYCGFKNDNKLMIRKRLSFDSFKKEIELLINWGYRTIEFVFSSDDYFTANEIACRIEYAKALGYKNNINLRIGINSEPLSYQEYKKLKASGLDFIVLWMETYNKQMYNFWHGSKYKKSDYQYRYETYERAIGAGIFKFGMGVLFGLHNWKEDVESLIRHANSIKKNYDLEPWILGVPRFKAAHSVKLNGEITKVSDVEFKDIVSIYKKAFPQSMIFFNTRENFTLNLRCCSDNDLFTIDCGTYPGAYLHSEYIKSGYEQFHTQFYKRELVLKKLKDHKIKAEFNW